jgi:hypothetical protein
MAFVVWGAAAVLVGGPAGTLPSANTAGGGLVGLAADG